MSQINPPRVIVRIAQSLWPLAILLTLSSCQSVSTTQAGTVGVQRGQAMLVSADQINTASAKQYSEIIADARNKGALDSPKRNAQRVKNISNRLIAQVGVFRTDARGWAWESHLINSPELNAWCMAGGKMAIYSGIIDQLKLTDDEIAVVMGHEISHALREHVREQVSQSFATNLGVSIASAALGLGEVGSDLMGKVAAVSFTLPNSRLHETEADRMGLELAARAGYNPNSAISLWQKMEQAGGGSAIKWLSTHPPYNERIADLSAYAVKVQPLYLAARKY